MDPSLPNPATRWRNPLCDPHQGSRMAGSHPIRLDDIPPSVTVDEAPFTRHHRTTNRQPLQEPPPSACRRLITRVALPFYPRPFALCPRTQIMHWTGGPRWTRP